MKLKTVLEKLKEIAASNDEEFNIKGWFDSLRNEVVFVVTESAENHQFYTFKVPLSDQAWTDATELSLETACGDWDYVYTA